MATWLNEYNSLKNAMNKEVLGGNMSFEQLMLYQELVYRIGVIETCQSFCTSAPVSTDRYAMGNHYKLVDAFIQCLAKERRFGQPADDALKAKRATANDNLEKVITDCRKRFSSFAPSGPEHYKQSISKLVGTVLTCWLQLRNTYINITK